MLNIYQWYYENIWPLKNKKVLVNYNDWKVLIQASIWKWKSFLFFDGPIFALYKSSSRTIINKDSKKWQIQLLFSQNDDFYLIIRKLTQTKTWKDSVKTEFYHILNDKNFVDYLDIISKFDNIQKDWNNIKDLLKFFQVKLENLTTEFKQERELQENLNDLLPEKDVACSTIFLPQNSENIFEEEPSKRIDVLKKIFWILGIDDAKKIIDEKKRELTWMLKSKQDTSSYKEKLKDILDKILKKREKIKDYNFWSLDEFIKIFNELDDDLFEINLDKLSRIDLDFESILKTHKTKQENYLKNQQQYKNIQDNIDVKNKEKLELETKLKDILNKIELTKDLEKKQELLKIDIKSQKLKLEKILEKQNNIKSKYDDLQNSYQKYLILENDIKKLKTNKLDLISEKEKLEKSLSDIDKKIKTINLDKTKQLEKEIKELKKELDNLNDLDLEKFTFKSEKVSSLKELENLIIKIETEWKNIKQNLEKDQENIEKLKQDIEKLKLEKNKQTILDFNCEKIWADCPFIEVISNKILWKDNFLLTQIKEKEIQLEKLQTEFSILKEKRDELANYWKNNNITEVKKNILKYNKKEEKYNKLILDLQNGQKDTQLFSELKGKKQEQTKNLKLIEDKIEKIWENIKLLEKEILEKQDIKNDFNEFSELQKNYDKENKKMISLQQELEKLDKKDDIIKWLLWEKKQIEENIDKIQKNIEKLYSEKEKLLENLSDEKIQNLQETEKNIISLKELVWNLNLLIDDYNKNKLSIINLKNTIQTYKELSNIFWKELVIYVFSDYMKALEDLINYFIQDIVNFQLKIQLDEKWENLDIFVVDELWKRPIQSLSWWQKTALRIGWILWISKLQNSKILFLDETINNFDQESIQIISRKIKEFTDENKIKFYMITHSEILQQADIWTEIINL